MAGGNPDGRTDQAIAVTAELLRRLHEREPPAVHIDSDLERDLGLDSLALMELRQRLEERLELHIPDDAAAGAATLGELLEAGGEPVAPRGPTGAAAGPAAERAAGTAAPAGCSTLHEVLDWHVDRHPDALHVRVLDGSGVTELTYGQLRGDAGQVAAALRAQGIGAGDTVALMLPTSADYFRAFMGALLAGAVPVPVYPPARPSQLEDHLRRHAAILDNAAARAMVTVPEAGRLVRLLRGQVPSLEAVLDPGDLAPGPGGGLLPPAPAAPGDTALLQYTSGSTAAPKGVILSHENLLANIRAMGEAAEISPGDVFVSWLPLYHDMGLIGAWLGTLTLGVPLVVMSPLAFLGRPARWLRAVHEHGGTLSASPNFGYELCVSRIEDEHIDGVDLGAWRLAFNGAEPVSPDTLERFAQRFAPFGFRRGALTPALVVGIPVLLGFLALPRRVAWRSAHAALGVVLRLTGIELRAEGTDRVPDGPCVVVAPHRSPLDGVALVAAVPGTLTFVVVGDLENAPVLGRILRAIGVVFVHRDDRARAVSGVDRIVEAVEGGARVVVFPESTMSTVAGLRAFRSGAFVVAARTGAPVVPVALQGVHTVLHPDQRLPRPATMRVAVGEPLRPGGTRWDDAMTLRDQVRDELLALLDEPDLA